MKTCFLVLAALAAAASPILAQDPEIPVVKTRKDPKGDPIQEELEQGEQGDDGDVARQLEEGGKVEHVEPALRNDLAFHMAPIVSVQPRRIAPGASGDAIIVLAMQRGSVLEVGRLALEYQRDQGPLHYGEWSISEPLNGVEPGAFRGQPVYESYAKITIPVTVSPDAKHDRYAMVFQMTALITDGKTGSSRGESRGVARGQLDVGPALPTPPAPRASRSGAAATAVEQVAEERSDPGEASPAEVDPGAGPLRAARGPVEDPALDPVEPGAGGGLPIEESGGRTLIWVGGGALGLIFLVLLLGLRRR